MCPTMHETRRAILWLKRAMLATVLCAAAPGAPALADDAQIAGWIEQLDSPRFAVRQLAMERLTDEGAGAIPLLARAAADDRLEPAVRAIEILRRLLAADDKTTQKASRRALDSIATGSRPSAARRAAAVRPAEQTASGALAPGPGNLRIRAGAQAFPLATAPFGPVMQPAEAPLEPAQPAARPAVAAALGAGLPGGPPTVPDLLPPAAREVVQQLAEAPRALAEKRDADAMFALQAVLDGKDDGLLPPPGQAGLCLTAKREALRLLGTLPAESLRLYELRFGQQARRLLGEAIRGGNAELLSRVSYQYFHTAAGSEAMLLRAYRHQNYGRPREAVSCLRWFELAPAAAARRETEILLLAAVCWWSAGEPQQAEQALLRLKSRDPDIRVRIGDRSYRAADVQGLLSAFQKRTAAPPAPPQAKSWPMFRSSAASDATGVWSGNLGELLWEMRLFEPGDPDRDRVRAGRQAMVESDLTLLPNLHPLAVGDVIVARTANQLLAIDGVTGKNTWGYPWPATGDADAAAGTVAPGLHAGVRAANLAQRLWEDAPYGRLSSDGRLLFLLDNLGPAAGGSPAVAMLLFNRRAAVPFVPAGSRSLPQLVALDLKQEGKIAWAVGGQTSPEEPRLEGVFFLGPPLCDQGRLYLLGEKNGDVSLYVLDAAAGRLLWSQLVAVPPRDVFSDPVRRLAGATLTLADGILVCPTTSGGVVAVEPATRMLRWACQYPVVDDRFLTDPPLHPWDPATEGLADAEAVVAEGRVILLAPDAKQLLCLDLATGRRLWARPRGDLLYVGCVDEGKVLAVGAHSVLALNLNDGAPAWRREGLALPPRTMLSGRGLLAGHCYWLPTAPSQLLQIDLREGRILREIKTQGALGNLIAYRNRLISQSLEAVAQFGPETAPQ